MARGKCGTLSREWAMEVWEGRTDRGDCRTELREDWTDRERDWEEVRDCGKDS